VLLLAADTGFAFGKTWAIGVLFVGLAVYAAVGALSHQRERAFSASLIYLALGALAATVIVTFDLAWLEPIEDAHLVERITEAALVVALFSTGLSLDRRIAWREWSTTARLIGIAMPLTIAGLAWAGHELVGLSLGAALLIGAALAPTDPVLAGDIGVGPPGDEDEAEPNFSLTAETGLNDGLAGPFVLAGMLVAAGSFDERLGEWLLADLLYAVVAGLAIGALVGVVAAWSVKRLRDRELLAPAFDGFHAIATAMVVYGTAEVASANGFVAALVGGLAFRRYERDHEVNARAHQGAEQVEKMLELACILLVGSMLTLDGLETPGWKGWLLAILLLVVIRPLSCAVALVRSRVEHPGERAFVAWFGVCGVGTVYYAALIAGAGVLSPAETSLVVWTVLATVALSIVVHGITSGPALRRVLARHDRERQAAQAQGRAGGERLRRPSPAPESSRAR
jgi:sodium/hydrogen antiporter